MTYLQDKDFKNIAHYFLENYLSFPHLRESLPFKNTLLESLNLLFLLI